MSALAGGLRLATLARHLAAPAAASRATAGECQVPITNSGCLVPTLLQSRPLLTPTQPCYCKRDRTVVCVVYDLSLHDSCRAAVRAMATAAAAGRPSVGKLAPEETALLVCDVQERFRPVISGFPAVIDTSRRMVGLPARGPPRRRLLLSLRCQHAASASSWLHHSPPLLHGAGRRPSPSSCRSARGDLDSSLPRATLAFPAPPSPARPPTHTPASPSSPAAARRRRAQAAGDCDRAVPQGAGQHRGGAAGAHPRGLARWARSAPGPRLGARVGL